MTVGKIENGLERRFVRHRLNYLSITDPNLYLVVCFSLWTLSVSLSSLFSSSFPGEKVNIFYCLHERDPRLPSEDAI